jgi:hypothetical protein
MHGSSRGRGLEARRHMSRHENLLYGRCSHMICMQQKNVSFWEDAALHSTINVDACKSGTHEVKRKFDDSKKNPLCVCRQNVLKAPKSIL